MQDLQSSRPYLAYQRLGRAEPLLAQQFTGKTKVHICKDHTGYSAPFKIESAALISGNSCKTPAAQKFPALLPRSLLLQVQLLLLTLIHSAKLQQSFLLLWKGVQNILKDITDWFRAEEETDWFRGFKIFWALQVHQRWSVGELAQLYEQSLGEMSPLEDCREWP